MLEANSFLRNSILRCFPFFRSIKRKLVWKPTVRAWQKTTRNMPSAPFSAKTRKIVIVPPDPYTLVGSRGDDAMIESLLGVVRKHNEDIQLYVITASDKADEAAKRKGLIPVQIWKHAFSPQIILSELKKISPDALAAIGADVMDGYYNPYLPFHALMFADLASRLGARCAVMGFSFNRNPCQELKEIFELVNPNVIINLRDSVSLERFNAFCNRDAELVADSAFFLEPDMECEGKIKAGIWVKNTHKAGRKAFGFNIHPKLFKEATQEQIDHLVTGAANAIEAVSKVRDVNWLLLPHDFRKLPGDNKCLRPLANELMARGLSERFIHFPEDRASPELKAIASQLDGVITARMHLAIASLGMGVPIAALTYQDKFTGLFQHFDLPEWLLLSPSESDKFARELETLMLHFIDESDDLKRKVREQLPGVKAQAMKNFTPLFPEKS